MKILVVGNPRSGTLSVKNMLRSAGYDVEHERNGRNGTVSCFFFDKATYYPREKMTKYRHYDKKTGMDEVFNAKDYDHVFHLVRNPLKCIPSMHKIVGVGHRQWLHDMGVVESNLKPKMYWSAMAWYETNRCIEKLNGTILRIEEINKMWPIGLYRPKKILHQHRSSGIRKSKPLTLRQLERAAGSYLYDNIVAMARRYGYIL